MSEKKIISEAVKEILFKMQVAKTNESSLLDVEDDVLVLKYEDGIFSIVDSYSSEFSEIGDFENCLLKLIEKYDREGLIKTNPIHRVYGIFKMGKSRCYGYYLEESQAQKRLAEIDSKDFEIRELKIN